MALITRNTREGRQFSGRPKEITEERVYAFSGGFPKGPGWPQKNIHTDVAFARRCGLPARNASGSMFEGYVTELMVDLFGENWLRGGKMELVFIRMVAIGDTVLPKAIVQSRQEDHSETKFVLEIWCENQHGNKVAVGTAVGLVQ
jgi:acyl dehydratase